MLEQLKRRLAEGLSLVQQGREIVAEVQENIRDAGDALSTSDQGELNAMLAEVSEESEALSARIQRA